jgi:hypothetical protein
MKRHALTRHNPVLSGHMVGSITLDCVEVNGGDVSIGKSFS